MDREISIGGVPGQASGWGIEIIPTGIGRVKDGRRQPRLAGAVRNLLTLRRLMVREVPAVGHDHGQSDPVRDERERDRSNR